MSIIIIAAHPCPPLHSAGGAVCKGHGSSEEGWRVDLKGKQNTLSTVSCATELKQHIELEEPRSLVSVGLSCQIFLPV